MTDTLNWGILSTGRIAGVFARNLARSKTGKLVAVGSRSQESADRFGKEFNVTRCYPTYEQLLADPEVQAVYIATPHPSHAEWAIKAAEAGKHILCEKPVTINHPEAMAVVEAARRHDVFFMEAFMYRCHPQTLKLVELLRARAIGDVRLIQSAFSFDAGLNLEGRLLNQALGGGGILDVGCYCVSFARLVAGVALGRDFAEPLEFKGVGRLGDQSRVDEWAVAVMKFEGDILAQVATGVRLNQDNSARVYGSEGWIHVLSPWIIAPEGGASTIVLHRPGKEPEEVRVETDASLYTFEIDLVAQHLAARQAPPPAMTPDDTLGNMMALDRWRMAIGLEYDLEKPAGQTLPVHKRPLRKRTDAPIPTARVPGLDKPVSRLVMGVDNQTWLPHAAVMFDDYFEHGGNVFDTAWIYGMGACEKPLGQWVKNRGVREHVVIIEKGAHTPWCNPADLTTHFLQSLGWLDMDYVDLYMMHRDNPDVPVGEFIDVLNEHKRAGRMRAFGVSNWTPERVDAANAYAASKGLDGIVAVSNNFSLARMVEPPWPGCLSASDPASRAWFAKTQLPLFAWSSQARGFFVRAHPDDRADAELVRCWYADDNFQRLERARELAAKKGVEPINIALAYVLHQPFPTFPLIGPRTLAEFTSSLKALKVTLTPEEVRWLNLEA